MWEIWLERLDTEWRTPTFYDIVKWEIEAHPRPTVLDIGCGLGFDGDVGFQGAIAIQAARFIGVEPDLSVTPPSIFTEVHRSTFEAAPIAPGSVDIAYAVMVMEHVSNPSAFWSRLREVLAPGGVFIAFSVNGAHWFSSVTRLMSATGLKSRYLGLLSGKGGAERYEDYPVYYRSNTSRRVAKLASGFKSVQTFHYGTKGNAADYLPRPLRAVAKRLDRLLDEPINIIIRAER